MGQSNPQGDPGVAGFVVAHSVVADSIVAGVQEALNAIAHAAIPLVDIGPGHQLIDSIASSSATFVVDPATCATVIRIALDACLANGTHLEVVAPTQSRRILRFISQGQHLHLELWLNVEIAGPGGLWDGWQLSGADLAQALSHCSQQETLGIKTAIQLTQINGHPHPEVEPLQRQRLALLRDAQVSLSAAEPDADAESLQRLQTACDLILCDSRADLRAIKQDALNHLTTQGLSPRRRWSQLLQQRLHRHWVPLGPILPVVGPDGAGKTYVCEQLAKEDPQHRAHLQYKKFYRNFDYKLLIVLMRACWGRESQTLLDERMSHYILIKSTLVSWLCSLKPRATRKVLLVDRYGWDYLLTGIRHKHQSPTRIRMQTALQSLIPRVSKCIIITARPQTVLERKRELDERRISLIYDEYCRLVAGGQALRAFFCNTELPYERARSDLNQFITKPCGHQQVMRP